MSLVGGTHQRGSSGVIFEFGVGAILQKKIGDFEVVIVGGEDERRVALVILLVYVGLGSEQLLG
jgi:hypothetical protein